MGVGYYQPLTQWSKGEYADARQPNGLALQDDLALIAAKLTYRADDHGGTAADATPLTPGVDTPGLIGRTGDVDCFSFVSSAGTATLTLSLVRSGGGAPGGQGAAAGGARRAAAAPAQLG